MRIGISGAQSTGKTTLLNALRSEQCFSNYTICNEVTRRVRSYGVDINEQGNDVTQKLIMQEHITNIFMHDNMITDRTALDGYVYTQYLYNNSRVLEETLEFADNVFNKVWPYYDHIFFIKPEFNIENDGVRSTNTEFRDTINRLFLSEIQHRKLNVTYLTGSVRQRVNTVLTAVGEKL